MEERQPDPAPTAVVAHRRPILIPVGVPILCALIGAGATIGAAYIQAGSPNFPRVVPLPTVTITKTTPPITVTPSPVPSTPSPSPSDDVTSAAQVYRSGPLSFNNDSRGTDLDADPSDPQWGRDVANQTYGAADLQLGLQGLGPGVSGMQWDFLSTMPTEAQCEADTSYESEPREFVKFSRNTYICIKTGQDRYAIARVQQSSVASLQLQVTVYKLPTDD